MKTIYLRSFEKDIKKIKNNKIKTQLKNVLLDIEKVDSVDDIANIKKLKSFDVAYRVRVGQYRLGMFIENKTVTFARFVKREDIYKIFP
ncbi:plasmid stabilization protein [Aquimarina sp. U1-2]|uniref:type II toxin-antitoxin system RelE family toxin n=1 Tax=Aquimarina sp. U1-2 TaxID=2823141 RepID=UPI001AECC655|nr:plasmid stabilization protein [Aquimarina sp. U1-2]MBP2833584.1 plasmid stabilization protein [Aquimarina sp. U1-2]